MGQWKRIRIIRYNSQRVTLGIWTAKRKIDIGIYHLLNSTFLVFYNFISLSPYYYLRTLMETKIVFTSIPMDTGMTTNVLQK